ncbi:hypothetical protein BSF44_34740 [Pseudomonas sp. ACN8]|uniref:Uncharacterized protein n=1 Tax=Pseudomonas fluorescens TaxID=294 RepID=A0A5E7UTS6_PSEFL|nr:hypothetical protein BSF44_34740 [Pseudomonas sp. ACN8]VVQ13890.1 hypothetical protein PS938_03967 [Pseudomonas fluorescens]
MPLIAEGFSEIVNSAVSDWLGEIVFRVHGLLK